MIESHTDLSTREDGPAAIWDKVRQIATEAVGRVRSLVSALPESRFARSWAGASRVRTDFNRALRRVAAGVGEGPFLNRFALHLVVIFLAVGVVAVTQVSLPRVDLTPPAAPTPAPNLGGPVASVPTTNRGANRFISNNTLLFQVPVAHTIIAERDRMEVITYTVQPNDNVFAIAQGFGLKPETIVWANPELETRPDMLRVGQKLLIPPVDGVYYTVKAGDTVAKLAKKYETTVEAIVNFKMNNLTEPYTLTPGQKIMLPGGRKKIILFRNIYPMERVGRPPSDAPKGSGRFIWPTQGILTQRYWSGHRAIDIANRTGTPIYAADDGYVVLAGQATWGYGNQVLIDHGNGYMTRYAHLHTILVHAGQSVKKGQQIGTMGNTGRSTGPHLHFEIIKNGVRQNPESYLR